MCLLFILGLLFPIFSTAETKTWTGFGGDTNWSNPLNWSGAGLPRATDDVLLDNSDWPVSYTVILPDVAVILRTIIIKPSPGRNIELTLPVSNIVPEAFTVTGPGYGIELNEGAVFRNASGLASGESMRIADSMIIHDGGRYIHQTRSSHANSILRFLSTASGTEHGIFDFNVPKASYTISVSNRTYGSLELHADAYGMNVNYTCTGAGLLLIHGNLRIAANVTMSLDLNGAGGNIQVGGDFIQEGGQLNLASGAGDNTVLRVKGDLLQSPTGTITETANGNPYLELNGERMQDIAMAGQILNQVGFRLNNLYGSVLRLPLRLPWNFEINQGVMTSSTDAMLLLDTGSRVLIDSSGLAGVYVDGPLRKLGLQQTDHFLFPVGKDGNLRWLELKGAGGNYTVEYFHKNPYLISSMLGAGLNHISKLEYWKVMADGDLKDQAKIELSFSSAQSGGVTDPDYLCVAEFDSVQWEDAGHTGVTGNFIRGSVLSANTDFRASDYTLASTVDFENPLPLTTIDLEVKEISGRAVFWWTFESNEIPDYFDLYEESAGQTIRIARINAVYLQKKYRWASGSMLKTGDHFFRIRMVDIHGHEYAGRVVPLKKAIGNVSLSWMNTGIPGGPGHLFIQSDSPEEWSYEIVTIDGRVIIKGNLMLNAGKNYLTTGPGILSRGAYVFRAVNRSGKSYSFVFMND